MPKLLIVESPAKAKTISAMLGSQWRVLASVGHVRDLPAKSMGVSRETLAPSYEVYPKKKEVVARLRSATKSASHVYLATDPDREGEAIAWHVAQTLRLPKKSFSRVTYNEITEKAIKNAINNPRAIDQNLVDAQQARRVLDRVVGYTVSPKLWDMSRGSGLRLSAGRVQTPTLRLVVERDKAIDKFKPTNHFGAELDLEHASPFSVKWDTKPFQKSDAEPYVLDVAVAQRAADAKEVRVKACEDGSRKMNAPPPFTTSALQQAASAKLKLSPDETMRLAQELFEQHHAISYHRTDSVHLAEETIEAIRAYSKEKNYPLPDKPNHHASKAKNAQEAHEAIRPTNVGEASPSGVTGKALKLYNLIRDQAIASQLSACILDTRKLTAENMQTPTDEQGTFVYSAKGQTVREPGFTVITGAPQETRVPKVAVGTVLPVTEGRVLEQQTKPPPRYTEGSLIRALEKLGIGRPSTWAAIIKNIRDRNYIQVKSGKVNATPIGAALVAALSNMSFAGYEYTADLEELLDDIANGEATYKDVVEAGWSDLDDDIKSRMNRLQVPEGASAPPRTNPAHDGKKKPRSPNGAPKCPNCKNGMVRRKSARGEFWGCSGYPDCKGTRPC